MRERTISRTELLDALVVRAAFELVNAGRPAVVRCAWCDRLVFVRRPSTPPLYCSGRCRSRADQAACRAGITSIREWAERRWAELGTPYGLPAFGVAS